MDEARSLKPFVPEQSWAAVPGGPKLAVWGFGIAEATGRAVLLVHGSSLNALSWLPAAEALVEGGLEVHGLDLRGHGASQGSPGGDYGWERFADDVLTAADWLRARPGRRSPATSRHSDKGRPRLLGAGHSAGATALLLAEARRPGTFAALWAWEPVIAQPGSDRLRERSKQLAERARRRRWRFSSLDDARAHLAGRGIFAGFSAAAFEGFLSGALLAVPATAEGGARGYVLACKPEDEARTYEASCSHDAWGSLPLVRCPTRVLRGERSEAAQAADLDAIARRLPAGEAVVVADLGHFGPFEAPRSAAADLARWAAGAPS